MYFDETQSGGCPDSINLTGTTIHWCGSYIKMEGSYSEICQDREYYTALHCTAQHCTTLNYTALHCTALHYFMHCAPLLKHHHSNELKTSKQEISIQNKFHKMSIEVFRYSQSIYKSSRLIFGWCCAIINLLYNQTLPSDIRPTQH